MPTIAPRRATIFSKNQDQRWNNLDNARDDRQNWRDQNREDWQEHREELWDYRGDRAEDIWDNARDFYDDVFDDRWWGALRLGRRMGRQLRLESVVVVAPAAFGAASPHSWTRSRPIPVYIDYGMNVIYEGETVYVDNQPIPAAQYTQPMIDLAVNVEQPPPPLPPAAPGRTAQPAEEWMPLGVFALAQEEKGDPIMFFQLSVNRAGVISGAYTSMITDDQRPIAGQVDKASQRVAWRIGDNTETIFVTSLANLTQDVRRSPFTSAPRARRRGCSSACPNPHPPVSHRNFPKRRNPRHRSRPRRRNSHGLIRCAHVHRAP